MNKLEITSHPDFDHHEVVEVIDAAGLTAIIAVHNTNLGPATGGCRMFDYAQIEDGLSDVLRLSRGMTYKSALAGLPLGGGKAVIIGDPSRDKTPAVLHALGDAIEQLGGRYVTAEDSGTGVEDMAVIGERTSFVSGVAPGEQFGGDPSPRTAEGVFLSIRRAVAYRHHSDLKGIHVAIQGAGHVGLHLVRMLLKAGAQVTVADINDSNVALARGLGAKVVHPDEIVGLQAEVFSPCAMGGVINAGTIGSLRAGIVAGAANNQLASPEMDAALKARDVLYAPDYVVNAGGIIDVYYQRTGERSAPVIDRHIARIGDTLTAIFRTSEETGRGTGSVADEMAQAIFTKGFKDGLKKGYRAVA